jgi:Uma2 family endonuclease
MSFALTEVELPIRIQRESPMTDDEFMSFCAANEPLRFERDANGEIIVMSPTGTDGSEVGIWLENGAELAWLIDPQERTVTIYRAGQEPEHLVDPTSVQGEGPVAGFELVMARVWG